jgi:hypothetical protein
VSSATNIDEVLVGLDSILAETTARRSRLALFPALYRLVTARVQQGIRDGRFADGPRMERLDAVFAGRYLDAFAGFKLGAPVTKSWRVAFHAAADPGLITLQHLLLGMNAHINLDLGIAAATICPGPAIDGLRADFDTINDVLGELLGGVQAALNETSPMLASLDRFCGGADESFAGFAIGKARKQAWRVASVLATLPPEHHPMAIALLDQQTATLGRLITRPDPTTRAALALIRLRESDDIPAITAALLRVA